MQKIIYPAATVGATRLTELVAYDAAGNVTSRTDTAGRVTTYEYDTSQRLKQVTDALLQVTQYQYNARSQMTTVSDGLNQPYTFTYDALGRVTGQTRGGHSMSLAYDAVGNRQSRTDYNGQTTTYAYDNLNRLTTITYPDTATANYAYDEVSRLTAATNYAGTVSFSYDVMGRVESTTDVFGQVITYAYDAAGNRTSLNREHQSVTYEYDEVNRLTQVGDSTGTASYSYNAVGQPLTRTLPNGNLTSYQYNGLSQLTTLQEQQGTRVWQTRQYSYNTAGQLSQLRETDPETGRQTHVYGYDAINRLTSATHTTQSDESYSYDAVGNRSSSYQESSYQYTGFNQLLSTASGQSYSYDFNGNRVTKTDGGQWHYTWDFENRLTQVQAPTGESVSYQYDALGRRVARSSTASGEVTNYTYDGQEVLLDSDSNGQTVEYSNGPGVDNKLAVNHSQWGTFYLSADQLGSTRAVTDGAGEVYERAETDSFGNGAVSSITRYGYTGREWDEEAGLYYYRARWYDQQQGRFLSEDPIGLRGGINFYTYVSNNPLNLIDPTGTQGMIGPQPMPRSGYSGWDRGNPPVNDGPYTGDPSRYYIDLAAKEAKDKEARDSSSNCPCQTALPRTPDFISAQINVAIPNPWTGTLIGYSGQVSMDAYGNLYWSPLGFGIGKSATIVSGSVTAGWLNQRCMPRPEQLSNLLSGPTFSITGGFWGGLGETWSPGNGTATQAGFVSPQFGGSFNPAIQWGNSGLGWR